MTYAEAVARLQSLRGGEHAGMRQGLERIEGLLDALGRPEQRYRLVQVGGTNGKGSVSAMLAAILKSAGHRVGLYTSPHLVSFRERIRVDGQPIAEDGVVDGVDALGTLIARFDATTFEATTALALDHFAREAVDVAVLEVGLGGRLDATTVGTPEVAVIARIDLDHQAVLGATLEAIAAEKAAIIRGGVAVSAAQAPEAERVIVARAAAAGVPLLLEGRDLSVSVERRGPDGQRLACAGPEWSLAGLELAMPGSFQPSNALLAVTAAREVGAGDAAIRDGLARAWWPGRFQVLHRARGFLVLDGAHNPAGARALAVSLRDVRPGHLGRQGRSGHHRRARTPRGPARPGRALELAGHRARGPARPRARCGQRRDRQVARRGAGAGCANRHHLDHLCRGLAVLDRRRAPPSRRER